MNDPLPSVAVQQVRLLKLTDRPDGSWLSFAFHRHDRFANIIVSARNKHIRKHHYVMNEHEVNYMYVNESFATLPDRSLY